MSRRAATIGVIASLGVLAGTVLLATRAKAAEPEVPQLPEWYRELIPTVDDILASKNMGELEVYYMYIGQLYFTSKISKEAYEALYQAYVTRFYDLIGDIQ